MAANPITLVILAIVALVAIFVLAWKNSETFRAIVTGAWEAIKTASVAVFNFLKGFIHAVWEAIKVVFTTYFNIYKAIVIAVWTVIKTVVTGAVNGVKAVITTVWNAIKAATSAVWNGIKTAVETAVGRVLDIVRGIKGKITGVFAGAGSWLLDAGKKIIQGLIDGVENMIGTLKSKLKSLTDLIPKVKGPPKKDAKLLTAAGESIIQGLVDGFDRGIPTIRKTLGGLTREIGGFSSGMNADLTLTAPGRINGSAGSLGNTYEISVTAPVGSSSADIGRELVQHITAFEKSGGRRAA
jgi:phage-related protein